MGKYIIVTTTTDSKLNAQSIAASLIESNLAACVQIIPSVESTFKWEGSVNKEKEILVLIKTMDKFKENVKKQIKNNHSYETPQIISFEFDILDNNYKKWFDSSIGEKIE